MSSKFTDGENKGTEICSDAVSRIEGCRAINCTRQCLTDYYDEWAQFYDKDMVSIKSNAHLYVAEGLMAVITGNRDDVRILDVASGTGLVGVELAKVGFSNIDALDPSTKSIEEAKVKQIYTNLLCTMIEDKRLDIANDASDGVTVCAATVAGHLPAIALYEILRILKPGGFFCLVGSKNIFDGLEEYNVRMRGIMKTLENEGKWKKLVEEVLDRYSLEMPEKCYRFIFKKI